MMQVYIGSANVISSLGFTAEENFNALLEYRSGISGIKDPSVSCNPLMASEIDWDKVVQLSEAKGIGQYTRLEQLFMLSIGNVIESSGIDASSSDCCFVFSTTKGNVDLLSTKSELDPKVFLMDMARKVTSHFNSANEPVVISNACISGVSALIVAARMIREGKCKNAIVAGGDLLTQFVASGFLSFKSVSANICRPYNESRDGLNLGEACGAILLTSDKSLSSGVVLEGGAITNDANHISGPSRTGDGLCFAMQQAMSECGVSVSDLSFINAHGTATAYNDEMESKAINMAGLQSLYVNSLKSYFGHTLGASGVIEAVMCIEQLKNSVAIGTKGFATIGVPAPIRVSGKHQAMQMRRCIKTASGFGGCNGAIVLALEEFAKPVKNYPQMPSVEVGSCSISEGKFAVNGKQVDESNEDFGAFIRTLYKATNEPNMKFFKMDDLCKLGYIGAEYLLKGKNYNPLEIGIVVANRSSSLDTDLRHQAILDGDGEGSASPAIFVYTLPNVVLGEICIRHKIKGENTFFVGDYNMEKLQAYAAQLLSRDGYKAVIYGWCDFLKDDYKLELKLIERQ